MCWCIIIGENTNSANSSGGKIAELRYHPWGGTRYTSGATPTSYQYTGQRRDGALTYLHGDHLGSASLSTDANGGVVSAMRRVASNAHTPYGSTRSGSLPTDRRFTGQREEAALGLYDFNARYFDPLLGRFIQADTIVPQPGNPQSLNRYAYTLENPLRYTDPSGRSEERRVGKECSC